MKYNRPKILRNIRRFIEKHNIKAVTEIPADAIVVVTLVKDFDPESNSVWEIQANKSYPREGIVCRSCQQPVVMSDGVFDMYSKNPVPNQVCCNECVLKSL